MHKGGPSNGGVVDFLVTNSRSRRTATPGRRNRNRSRSRTRSSSLANETSKAESIPELQALPNLYAQMGGSDWRARQDALREVVKLVVTHKGALGSQAACLRVFDHVTPRLTDNNSKVNLYAVKAMHQLIPAAREHISSVLPSFLSALASNLASASRQIYAAASEAFTILMANVESTTAFKPVLGIAASSSPRVKAALFDRITDMLPSVAAKKPDLLVRHALPTVLSSVDGCNGDLRLATHRLLKQLYRCMGDEMIRAVRIAHVASAVKETVLQIVM